MTNEALLNNRVNQVTGATDWLTFSDMGFPDLPETYTIEELDTNRATDGGHYRGLYGIRLGKIPDPATLRIFEYLADSNSDSFDSDSEAGAEYTRAASWPPAAGEFATSGNGDIVYFHASQVGVQVAVLPYSFRATPLTIDKIRDFAQEAVSGSELDAIVDAAVDDAVAAAIAGASFPFPPMHRSGLTLANNGTDIVNDIDVAAGSCRDDSDSVNMVYAGGTVQCDVLFGTGDGCLDAGAIGNGTYHLFAIYNASTEVTKILSSLSATSPTMPSGYAYKRRIGAINRVSDSIRLFFQHGNSFLWKLPILDINVSSVGASQDAVLGSSIPSGVKVLAHMNAFTRHASSNFAIAWIFSKDQTDATAAQIAPLANVGGYVDVAATQFEGTSQVSVLTDTFQTIRVSAAGGGVVRLAVTGYTDLTL